MRNLNRFLENKSINYDKLLEFGFIKKDNKYVYEKFVCNDEFKVVVEIDSEEQISKVVDVLSNEEYILVDTNSVGSFVGKVRSEYESILNNIIKNCTIVNIFKESRTKEIINYIHNKYNDDPEFLWDRIPDCAIFRNKVNNKWYGVLMRIKASRLGLNDTGMIEVLNVKYQKDKIDEVIDNKTIFPGYHMNKRSWVSIVLGDDTDLGKVKLLVDNSYKLLKAKGHNKIDDLSEKTYQYLKQIPRGKVVTYKQVAEYLGNSGFARIVGTILHNNPDGEEYPCYKVLNSKGELADEFVFGGKEVQKKRLEKDGIVVNDYKVDLNVYKWDGK